ncbi:MAG: hypothetical protein E7621_04225 [Ruminococcaceae bacterium]|nr:hypothetical protein [Oscillospiraceae bacterium]
MKFNNINLTSFGKFENASFNFSKGLNVIYGENEAGKSTLSSALRYILYGFSSQKSRNVETNDKLKYASWKNGNMAASAALSVNGKDYRIERVSSAKSSVKVTDSAGRECNFGKEPGEAFLGVDETAFIKMACIRQSEISSDTSDGLSEIVQNIVYSADESVDITKAEKKLTEYRNFFRSPHRKTGKCFELEEKIASLRFAFGQASEAHKTLLGAEARLSETKKRIEYNNSQLEKLEKELLNIEGYEASVIIEKVLEAKKNLDLAKQEFEKADGILKKGGKLFDEKTLRELSSAYEAEKRSREEMLSAKNSLEQLKKSGEEFEKKFSMQKNEDISSVKEKYLTALKNIRIFGTVSGVFAVSAAVFAVLGFIDLLRQTFAFSASAALLGAAIVLFIIGIVGFLRAKSKLSENGFESLEELVAFETEYDAAKENFFADSARMRILKDAYDEKLEIYNANKEKLDSLMESTGAESSDAQKVITILKDALSRYENAKNTLEKSESIYDAFLSTNDMHALSDAVKHFTNIPEREKKLVLRDFEFIKKANEQLAEREKELIKQASYNASSIRKPAEILAEKEATEELLVKAVESADAADLALSALKAACEDLKNGISPEIARRASRLFKIFTDGKYEGLEVSSEFGLGIIENGMLKEAAYLSRGTKDVAYLSLRMALCEVLFKEKPIVILDEIFAYVDDTRFKAVLGFIERISAEYQVFVFTCHEREKAALAHIEGTNVIVLE